MSPYPRWERAADSWRLVTAGFDAPVIGPAVLVDAWINHIGDMFHATAGKPQVTIAFSSLDDALSWCAERAGVEMGA